MASAVDCTGERTAAAAGPHGAPQADAFPAAADTSTHEMGLSRRKQPYAGDKKHGAKRHQALAEWIWAYFSSTGCPHVLDGCQTTLTSHAEPAAAPRGDASSGRQPHAGAHLSDDSSSSSVKQHGPINAFTLLRQQGSVIMTGKPPLYFQHEGHSRTIVGIEKTLPLASQQLQQSRTADGGASTANTAAEYNLVVLDPGMPQDQLYSSLR